MYVSQYVYIHICICICIYTYVYAYVYIYTHACVWFLKIYGISHGGCMYLRSSQGLLPGLRRAPRTAFAAQYFGFTVTLCTYFVAERRASLTV